MAKRKDIWQAERDEVTEAPAAAAAAADDAPAAPTARPRTFEVRTPVVDFKGTRFGIKIDDGKGYTDDETKARACAACGYKVIDRQTGEPAVFDDADDAAK
jgi:hypothetical protein